MSTSGAGSDEPNIIKRYLAKQPSYEESLRSHEQMLKRLSENLGENVKSLKEYQEKKFLKESQRRVNEGREAAWKAIPSHQKAAALEAGQKRLFGAWGIESPKPAYRASTTSTTSTVNTHKKRLANMQKAINNAKKEKEKQAEEQMKEIGNFLASANNNDKRKGEEQMKEIGDYLAAANILEIEEFLKEPNNTTKKPKQGGKRKTRRRQTKKKQTKRRRA